jgi:hypothetical protein
MVVEMDKISSSVGDRLPLSIDFVYYVLYAMHSLHLANFA